MANTFAPFPAYRLSPDQVVLELRDLPSAPKVLPRLKRLLSNGNSALPEIVTLIRLDPAIAAHVLQTHQLRPNHGGPGTANTRAGSDTQPTTAAAELSPDWVAHCI